MISYLQNLQGLIAFAMNIAAVLLVLILVMAAVWIALEVSSHKK